MQLSKKKNDLNIEIVSQLNGTSYLTGSGAKKNYLDIIGFTDLGIQIKESYFEEYLNLQPYRQDAQAIKTNILDMLFSLGAECVITYFENVTK
jgi:hypothetical protein